MQRRYASTLAQIRVGMASANTEEVASRILGDFQQGFERITLCGASVAQRFLPAVAIGRPSWNGQAAWRPNKQARFDRNLRDRRPA